MHGAGAVHPFTNSACHTGACAARAHSSTFLNHLLKSSRSLWLPFQRRRPVLLGFLLAGGAIVASFRVAVRSAAVFAAPQLLLSSAHLTSHQSLPAKCEAAASDWAKEICSDRRARALPFPSADPDAGPPGRNPGGGFLTEASVMAAGSCRRYYHVLVPLTLPVTLMAIAVNWFSLKSFCHG